MDQLVFEPFIYLHAHVPDVDIDDIRFTLIGVTPYEIQQCFTVHQPILMRK
ncbi:hypothetical protein D3C75_1332580 [compost metagenome]